MILTAVSSVACELKRGVRWPFRQYTAATRQGNRRRATESLFWDMARETQSGRWEASPSFGEEALLIVRDAKLITEEA